MELRGAVALVTGGNGGLGQRICDALAKEGVHIAVMYAQSREQAEGVSNDLTSRYQINAAAFACDITDGAAVERLLDDVTNRFGRIDIVVNDAAYNKAIPFADLDGLTMEVWDTILAVNLTTMRASAAQDAAQVLRGRSLEIVDASGRVRASLGVLAPAQGDGQSHETVLLRLITERGRPSVKIGASEETAGLSFAGPTGTRETYVILQSKGQES